MNLYKLCALSLCLSVESCHRKAYKDHDTSLSHLKTTNYTLSDSYMLSGQKKIDVPPVVLGALIGDTLNDQGTCTIQLPPLARFASAHLPLTNSEI